MNELFTTTTSATISTVFFNCFYITNLVFSSSSYSSFSYYVICT